VQKKKNILLKIKSELATGIPGFKPLCPAYWQQGQNLFTQW